MSLPCRNTISSRLLPYLPALWQPASADCIQLAKNHLIRSMSRLSRLSPAGQKSARPNHIQLTKVNPSISYYVDQEAVYCDHVLPAAHYPIHLSQLSPDIREPGYPDHIQISWTLPTRSILYPVKRAQARLDWGRTFETHPVLIGSNNPRTSPSNSYPAR
jgi:hypothetical protein